MDFGGFADGFEFDVSDDERDAPAQAPWDFSGKKSFRAGLYEIDYFLRVKIGPPRRLRARPKVRATIVTSSRERASRAHICFLFSFSIIAPQT